MDRADRLRRTMGATVRLAFLIAFVGLIAPPHDGASEPSVARQRSARTAAVSQDAGRLVVTPSVSSADELHRTSDRSKWSKLLSGRSVVVPSGVPLAGLVLGALRLGRRRCATFLIAASRGPPRLRTT